jgi:L-serine/L-threonine ammonia-lyase
MSSNPRFHIDTPLISSLSMRGEESQSIWLKMDALQPSGSFKLRGVGHACQTYASKGATRFVTSSGGNAGLAVAYSGRLLKIPVVVVVPLTSTDRAKELIRMEGAEVIVHGATWHEANDLAVSMLLQSDAYIHPFDDSLLWEGHATLIDEVARTTVRPDAVVLSVGGGGLLCGVVEGLKRNAMDSVPVIAVETEGAASFRAAYDAGRVVELDRITSIASSLGNKRVCEQAMRCVQTHPIQSQVVSDKSAVVACERFLADHRVLVEPACGASLAIVYENNPALAAYKNILVVVCGGVTATVEQLRIWSART